MLFYVIPIREDTFYHLVALLRQLCIQSLYYSVLLCITESVGLGSAGITQFIVFLVYAA